MQDLKIEATNYTPYVFFDVQNNDIVFKGQSYPENAAQFYNEIFNFLEKYLDELDENVHVNVELKLIYLNTSSSKAVLILLDQLDKAYKKGKNININWHYHKDNELAMEIGKEFKEDLNLPFNLVMHENQDDFL
jgi:hypothetical protein